MRTQAAILAGKIIHQTIKTLNSGGGSAAPGYYALKFQPQLVEILAKRIPRSIIITGTNGKTTTAKMLAQFAQAQGLKVIRNATGSNLERGIASAFLQHLSIPELMNLKTPAYDLAIWEVDEAAFNTLAPKIRPEMVIFLNIFRDQLDRYGEIDSVLNKWVQTVSKLPKSTQYLLNGSDPNLIQLATSLKGHVQTFGISGEIIEAEKNAQVKPITLDIQADSVKNIGLNGVHFRLRFAEDVYSVKLPIPGKYHIYDFLAAFGASQQLKIPFSTVYEALQDYAPAFGRVEQLSLSTLNAQAKSCYIFLIKNPYGATQVFETIQTAIKSGDVMLCALNDNFADGTDVSWIWDAKWEVLTKALELNTVKCVISGTRAEDLAVRLKYAGVNTKQLVIEKDDKKALEYAISQTKNNLFILPTYTWLLSLQKLLTQKGLKESYWKNNA